MKRNPTIPPVEKAAFALYDFLWRTSLPALRRNKRLAEGFDNRLLKYPLKKNAHIWIQAASGGEAYLAWELLKNFTGPRRLAVVLTTNTSQGRGILEKAVHDLKDRHAPIDAQVAFFPFDMPSLMRKAVHRVNPRIMVLLETEIWPGLLLALKRQGCPAVIVNGRMTKKSLSRYGIWPTLWRSISPDRILAISKQDAARFTVLFGKKRTAIMPNIKFDRLQEKENDGNTRHAFETLIPPATDFAVLGSVRQEEETEVQNILSHVRQHRDNVVLGLFPRHLHRVPQWEKNLDRIGLPWRKRSEMRQPAKPGEVVIGDVFGELNTAYQCASAAFVGGSLAPLGGQNFLEPLMAGLQPVIGPHWENFTWIGTQIMDQGLVKQANSWHDVARLLIAGMAQPVEKAAVRRQAADYVRKRKGGTQKACELIKTYL